MSSLNLQKSIFIEGDKTAFNSKIAVDKFKKTLKDIIANGGIINLEELQKKYVKSTYKLEMNNDDKNIIIKILEPMKEQTKEQTKEQIKRNLKERLKEMSNNRTNITYHKAKNDENISDEILKEYLKLKKISQMPVPEPSEIFKNPEEFKPLFNMILNPLMTSKMGTLHPYIKYFKLIADKLNFTPSNIIPEQELPQIQKEQKTSEQIKSNKISNKDDDTDDEDDNSIITE
jgi:hypothetical protein